MTLYEFMVPVVALGIGGLSWLIIHIASRRQVVSRSWWKFEGGVISG